jgi:uncharacterized RDD family membrane protein YckC
MTDLIPVGFSVRLGAFLIDSAVNFGFLVVIAMFTEDPLAWWAVSIAYWVVLWSRYGGGQTIGMKTLNIKVVRSDGQPLSLGGAAVRYLGFVLSSFALGIGLLAVAWDPKRQGWHDKIASTYVIKA